MRNDNNEGTNVHISLKKHQKLQFHHNAQTSELAADFNPASALQ